MTGRIDVLDLSEVDPADRARVGGKAAGLATMIGLGLRVPPGFVVTTDAWRRWRDGRDHVPDAIWDALERLEAATGRRLGDPSTPLLVSVRSGAPTSMPGMLDTILDVGIDAEIRAALARTDGEAFARSCHRRFLVGWARSVCRLELDRTETDPDAVLASLVATGHEVPDPRSQLPRAIEAVWRSWTNERALAYRGHHDLDHEEGTAVVVQAMAFGDRGARSGTGVACSRDPGTGAAQPTGDFLARAQGEDVVGGTHAPAPLAALAEIDAEVADELHRALERIEAALGDAVDVEFTVEDGTLHLLQCRTAKRSAAAAVRIAVDLAEAGTISRAEAVARTSAMLDRAERSTVATGHRAAAIGLGACPGVATGKICLSADAAARSSEPVILIRTSTSPEDVHGMVAAVGVVTTTGGLVSHAALVARELDLPTIVGAADLVVDEAAGIVRTPAGDWPEGTEVTIDGGTGAIHLGRVPVDPPVALGAVARLRGWGASL